VTGARAAAPALRTGEECWVAAARRAMVRALTPARVAATPTAATDHAHEHSTSDAQGTARQPRSGTDIASRASIPRAHLYTVVALNTWPRFLRRRRLPLRLQFHRSDPRCRYLQRSRAGEACRPFLRIPSSQYQELSHRPTRGEYCI
jgi:hypothetical protein